MVEEPTSPADDTPGGESPPFRDAEAWLAARGIEREPLRVSDPPPPTSSAPAPSPVPSAASPPDAPPGPVPSARDAVRLAEQAAADARQREGDAAAIPSQGPRLEDDVAAALAFVRRSTSGAPQSSGRVRAKLAERGTPRAVIDQALERAERERLVDDLAMAGAFVDERRRKGHAAARIRRDLASRGFEDATIDAVLAPLDREDPEAAAFAVAQQQAARLTGVATETAFRRVAGHLARRGYPDALARKVAREAVFASRDAERTAGH